MFWETFSRGKQQTSEIRKIHDSITVRQTPATPATNQLAHSGLLPYGLTCNREYVFVKMSVIFRSFHFLFQLLRFNLRNGQILLVEMCVLFLEEVQITHQQDATLFQFVILTFIYISTCFGCFSTHHQELNDCSGSLWFYLRIVVIVVLCSCSGRPVRIIN